MKGFTFKRVIVDSKRKTLKKLKFTIQLSPEMVYNSVWRPSA